VQFEGGELTFPAGAVETEVEIVVEPVAVPAGYTASRDLAYRFRPEGLAFRAPVTVRFEIAAGDEDASVYWSRSDGGVEARPTRIEDGHAVASIEHFSLGFAGWPSGADGGTADSGMPDGGMPDGGVLDAGTDTGTPDVGTDASDDAGMVTGVTCVVAHRTSCDPATPVTYTDVPFQLVPVSIPSLSQAGLTSPLEAFRTLSLMETPIFHGDLEGRNYFVGGEGVPNISRRGLRIEVDVHVSRTGLGCPSGEPLIRIDCTGSTLVSVSECRSAFGFEEFPPDPSLEPVSCVVLRRDTTCAALAETTEAPIGWLAPGWHTSESELWLRSPALNEATGGDLRAYQEHPCDSYLLADGPEVVLRRASEFWVESLTRSSGSCRDGLGTLRPRLQVTCRGAGVLIAPPP
jgi:hypothetical protein